MEEAAEEHDRRVRKTEDALKAERDKSLEQSETGIWDELEHPAGPERSALENLVHGSKRFASLSVNIELSCHKRDRILIALTCAVLGLTLFLVILRLFG